MADKEIFDPLDPLGPEYGKINQPIPDAKGLSAFEGDLIDMPKANIPKAPENYFPALPKIDNLNRPNRSIINNLVKTNTVNPSIPKKPIDINEYNKSTSQYIDSFFQANQDKNNYAKIYSYNAGPDGNAFYKRYAAYGQKKFDEIGFSPLRDNEANFNARTTKWDDFSRMMTHSFIPLFTRGFVSGPKSLAKMLHGDFTSSDLEDAKLYEEAAAIGNSSKKGIFGFVNNTVMNFGYTAGIITEAVAEEAVGALFAAPTGGTSLIATTANNLRKIPNLFRGINSAKKGYDAVRNTLKLTETMNGARNFWKAATSSNFVKSSISALNPLENTLHAIKGFKQADNLTDLAILSKTAGGFYRDVRKINMALSEARLEAGMVENHVYNKLYNEAYIANNNQVPNNKELAEIEKQAKDASYETLLKNTALIYVSNGITFHNITSPRGGIRNFIKSTTDDIAEIASREGEKNFGKLGKVIYDRTAKKFAFEKNNLKTLVKGWLKNPIHKSVMNTVGYFKANFTEGIQENLQETIAEANEKYFIDSYKSPTLQTMLYSRAAMNLASKSKQDYFGESWSKQNPFTAQGFETFASGFFMGTLAGPLNSAVPFLSSNYNKMFNKEQYQKWKDKQTEVSKDLVEKLNNIDLQTLMSDKMENLGVQDIAGDVRNRENKKAGLDAEVESYIFEVEKLKNTGTFEIFKEKLEGLKDATDEEFADAVNIDLDQVSKYRTRLDKSVARLDKIKNLYEKVEKKNPNPININDLDKEDPNYAEKVYLHKAWNTVNRNMVFFNETYDDILYRRAKIDAKFNSNPKFQKINNRQRNILFNPITPQGQFAEGDMVEEIELLKRELEVEKDSGKNQNKIRIIEEQIKLTQDYIDKFKAFDKFFNRSGYANQYAEEIKEKTGKEATTEDILKYMDDNLGDLDNETIRIKITKDLRESYKNYIQKLGKQKGEDIFDSEIDLTFENLIDYYKLGQEKQNIAKYVDLLNDQDAFLDAVRRNTEWIRAQDNKRTKYFEDLIRNEMDKVRANALLNELANKGLYISLDDLNNFLTNGIPPKDIYNNITKELYKIGSDKYKEIYQEYFQKYNELKSQLNPKKTGVVDAAYQAKIDELEKQMEEEIEKLVKKPTKRDTGEIKGKQGNKTISINEVVEQLNIDEYVELKINKDSEPLILYKDKDENIRLNNIDGEIVDIQKIKDRYSESKKYKIEMLPDPVEVERITNAYNEKIEEEYKAYVADKETIDLEIPFEEITQDTNLDTPDLIDFRNQLYLKYQEEYVANLSEEEQNALLENSDLDEQLFEQWYSMPENKKYFDEYNDKNRPTISEKETVLTVNGVTIDTKNRTLEQLIETRDAVADKLTAENEELEFLDPVSEKEAIKESQKRIDGLALDLKNLNVIIAARQFAKYPEEIKESVRSIQKLFKAQNKVEKGVTLTEDDEVTGLRKGQKAYRIDGKFHRRMTQAMQDVIDEEYEYQGQKSVDTVFDQTIGKNGLNSTSAKEFVSRLRTLSESDEQALPGTNKLFFDALEDELKLLPSLTAEQIKLEKQKVAILEKADEEKNAAKKEALYEQAVEIQNKIDGVTAPVSTDAEANVVKVYHHTNVAPQNFNFGSFQRGDQQVSQFGDGLNASSNTTPFLVKIYGNPIEGEINDSDFIVIDANKSEKELYEELKSKGYKFNNPATGSYIGNDPAKEYDGTEKANVAPAIISLFNDFQKSNPQVKGVKVINHIIGNQKVDPFYVIYNAKSFYGPGSLSKTQSGVSTDTKADVERRREEEFNNITQEQVNDLLSYESGKGTILEQATRLINNYNRIYKTNAVITDFKNSRLFIKINGYETSIDSEAVKLGGNQFVYGIDKTGIQELINAKYDAELASLGTAETVAKDNFDTATKRNTTKDIINSFFAENSYEDSRVAGNFFDLAKDYLESGKKPEFNEKIITREAYDDLIAYLDTIKTRVDSGELYIVGRDLVVFDSDIEDGYGRKDRIAGEIDLILADKDGIYVVDIKSGEAKKFLNFNNLSTKKKVYSKRNEYTIQTAGYATMLERMIDRKIAGLAMLPVERESNKETNQVIAAGSPAKGSIFKELEYKRDTNGNIIVNNDIDPKTGKPFNEKQFEQTKNQYKFDFLVPLYRESVQKEMDKLFPQKKGKLAPGVKRALSNRYKIFRESLNEITDEQTKENINKIIRIEKLINDSIKKDNITIPKDIADLLEQKKKLLRVYTAKETIDSVIKTYKDNLSRSEATLKRQSDALKNVKADVSFDDIDKSVLEDDSDFINEQLEADKNFEYYYNEHDKYKNEDAKLSTLNQQLAVQTMKASSLLTDEDIEDDLIDELSMADASELIHEGVKRIQYLKTETTDEAANKFKDYQSKIFSLMTATKINTNNLLLVELLEKAKLNAEEGLITDSYRDIQDQIESLKYEFESKFVKEKRKEKIEKEIADLTRFNEALALAYEIPTDIFENIIEEEEETIEDEYSNEIKPGIIVYSRENSNKTEYKVKSVTSKNIILEDKNGKEISVEIGKFDEQYITESEMNADNFTPPEYNPTEGEKSVMQESQMSVEDFLKNSTEDRDKAHQEGISNTLAQNRENLLNKTKDCP